MREIACIKYLFIDSRVQMSQLPNMDDLIAESVHKTHH